MLRGPSKGRKKKTELQRPKQEMRKALRHTKKNERSESLIQFNDAISTFQPLKKQGWKDDPALFTRSFKCIISTKSRKQSHSSL